MGEAAAEAEVVGPEEVGALVEVGPVAAGQVAAAAARAVAGRVAALEAGPAARVAAAQVVVPEVRAEAAREEEPEVKAEEERPEGEQPEALAGAVDSFHPTPSLSTR